MYTRYETHCTIYYLPSVIQCDAICNSHKKTRLIRGTVTDVNAFVGKVTDQTLDKIFPLSKPPTGMNFVSALPRNMACHVSSF